MPQTPGPRDILRSALLITATAVVVVVLPAIDMPAGYMGGQDELTGFGRWYSIGLSAATVVAVVGELKDTRWGRYFSSLLYSTNIGIFVPGLAADPIPAVLVIVWQLIGLGLRLVHPELSRRFRQVREGRRQPEKVEQWFQRWGPGVGHALAASVVLTVAVVGYRVTDRWMALAICMAVNVGALAGAVPFLKALVLRERSVAVAPALPWLGLALAGPTMTGVLVALALSNVIVLVLLVIRSPLFEELLEYFFDFPAFLIVASFGIVILFGSVLLTLPAASPGPTSVSPIDALFTSTSATCVTGLIVLDTPNDFTMFGQGVILGLIQVGGLGIMVVSTFGAVILGRDLGLRGGQALGDLMDIRGAGDAYRLTRFIVTTTLTIEAVGTALITLGYLNRGRPFGEALWHGLFHAISAFCNAGFALQTRSIVMFKENPWMLGVFAALIVTGGIGFVVLATAWSWIKDNQRPKFDMQARVILVMTGALLVSGTILYGAVEWSATLQGLSAPDKLTNAIFQSVTLRTAGFNSVGFDAMRPASLMFMMLFMFIGASPGSTAGGIKTTTVAVLLGAVRSIATGKTRVVFFGRRVPQRIVYRSAAIAAVAVFFLVTGAFVLFLVEDIAFEVTLFETFSALGTVGLSIGATGQLHAAGKLTVIVLMFVGRIGPLTVALLLSQSESSNLNYPESEIMVG